MTENMTITPKIIDFYCCVCLPISCKCAGVTICHKRNRNPGFYMCNTLTIVLNIAFCSVCNMVQPFSVTPPELNESKNEEKRKASNAS